MDDYWNTKLEQRELKNLWKHIKIYENSIKIYEASFDRIWSLTSFSLETEWIGLFRLKNQWKELIIVIEKQISFAHLLKPLAIDNIGRRISNCRRASESKCWILKMNLNSFNLAHCKWSTAAQKWCNPLISGTS